MRKQISKLTLLFLSSLMIVACAGTPKYDNDVQHANYVRITHPMPLKKVHDIIKEAGEQAGWRMTEFKDNALIAEKISDEQSNAVTIDFSTDSFHLNPQNSELQDAIAEKLNSAK
jgi:hypothetical protein